MNKLTKGTLAGAAAVALLLGTGGTLAYWNDTVSAGSATISAGTLAVSQQGAATWSLEHRSVTTPNVQPSEIKLVPGDKLTYTSVVRIAAQGDNLDFTVDLARGAVSPSSGTNPADQALADALVGGAVVSLDPVAGTVQHRDGELDTRDYTVTATLTWPFDDNTLELDRAARLGSVNLSNFTVTVQQVERVS